MVLGAQQPRGAYPPGNDVVVAEGLPLPGHDRVARVVHRDARPRLEGRARLDEAGSQQAARCAVPVHVDIVVVRAEGVLPRDVEPAVGRHRHARTIVGRCGYRDADHIQELVARVIQLGEDVRRIVVAVVGVAGVGDDEVAVGIHGDRRVMLLERSGADLHDRAHLAPAELNRWATTFVSPPGSVWTHATSNFPRLSIATEGEPSSRLLELTTISGPVFLPAELNRWARMSWSVELNVSVQTTTEEPLAELALAEPNWALRVVVFTVAENSLPSDINCRPSSDSSRGRFFVRGRDRSEREVKKFMVISWFGVRSFVRSLWLASKGISPTGRAPDTRPNGFLALRRSAGRRGLIWPRLPAREAARPGEEPRRAQKFPGQRTAAEARGAERDARCQEDLPRTLKLIARIFLRPSIASLSRQFPLLHLLSSL